MALIISKHNLTSAGFGDYFYTKPSHNMKLAYFNNRSLL